MAYIRKEIEPQEGVLIRVLEYEKSEESYNYPEERSRIIDLEVDSFSENMTPDELIELADKLKEIAEEIKRDFDEYGRDR